MEKGIFVDSEGFMVGADETIQESEHQNLNVNEMDSNVDDGFEMDVVSSGSGTTLGKPGPLTF